ncbi:hypothetical protein VOLCADRAFT_98560 [Volvox carteri f. nagariensis]|uniref:RRM domain-containing protein n=1 Tax=Volvox carteri f. nagariensis TaxID=3068 RepID=D8UFN8_VOLCA|nr:uncharacterized protein VOLCADRAFT_98560 [Volvox carteri f. nagariensis]EFJ41492.1 hypothetical protein VOLCADRAFT_98560 [Volvox carteri f. nagariensis]|eukprot:XP_002957437.1 hypothetical protein VOLCADRAFT_98560 [Volvox carteri f. nagariensis]
MTAVKVLFSGAVEADLPGLFKKVETANKKNGPFEALLCTGQFFGAGSSAILTALPASKAPLKYLGRSGVTNIKGLNVAFLDGVYNHPVYTGKVQPSADTASCPYYTPDDVALLKAQLQALEGEVDVLLTCEWPRGLTTGIQGPLPEGYRPGNSGSNVVSELVALARPRYHIAGGEALHYARPPFSHRDLGAGVRVTRFVGLAPMGHPAKAKSLHALGLVPAAAMEPEALCVVPEGCTTSPFELRQAKREQEEMNAGGEFSRWQQPGGGSAAKRQRREAANTPQPIAGRPDVPRDPWKTVVVKNVPWAAGEEEIAGFFAQAGQVVNVWRGTNNRDGRVQAFTHVQFETREGAERALQLHNCDFNGRQVFVEPSTAGTAGSGRRGPGAAAGGSGDGGGGGEGKPVEGCWFCLGSASADTELVASVGEEVYLAVDKGPITPEHVLIVPIDHMSASVGLSPQCFAEMERYLSALRSMYASLGRELVAFERHLSLRNKGGNHCHINVLGVTPAAGRRAGEAFNAAAAAAGYKLELLPPPTRGSGPDDLRRQLHQAVGGPDSEYFMAVLPDGCRLVRPLMRGERWPMALGREVLADLAGVPERASWKQCSSSPEEERQRVERFKQLFKPYDVMQQGDVDGNGAAAGPQGQ